MRVSQMRFTIHFSPSSTSRERLSRSEVAGCQKSQTGTPKECGNTPDVYLLMNPAIPLANQVLLRALSRNSSLDSFKKKILPKQSVQQGSTPSVPPQNQTPHKAPSKTRSPGPGIDILLFISHSQSLISNSAPGMMSHGHSR